MPKNENIRNLILQDVYSKKKKFAKKAQDYYDGRHDIMDYRIFYINRDGKLEEDVTRSNVRVSHAFFTELVDQEVQYILSGGLEIEADEFLKGVIEKDYFHDHFLSELQQLLEGTVIKGFDYLYAYLNKKMITQFKCIDGLNLIEAKKEDGKDCIIRYYTTDDSNEIYVEIWDGDSTSYYILRGDELEKDSAHETNPCPHIVYEYKKEVYMKELGYIPLFRLDNNRKQMSGLVGIKGLIDDYDVMDCGLSNNLQDINEGIFVVKGYEGTDMDELQFNVRRKKIVGVGENGDLDIKTINIPFEARKAKLELDDKNIYRFGMGFNSAQTGDGNITNVVIKSRYALLDLKCNKLKIRIKRLLNQLLNVIISEINTRYHKSYGVDDVRVLFRSEVMTNALDNASIDKLMAETQQIKINTILYVAHQLPEATITEQICEVLELSYENIKEKTKEKLDTMEEVEEVLNE